MTTESATPEILHPWAIYLMASEEARSRGDHRTGTEHLLLALMDDPSIELLMGVTLSQARLALAELDNESIRSLGIGHVAASPELPRRAVPKKPKIRDVMTKDRVRMTPVAKKVLEDAVKPKRRKMEVTAVEVLREILALQSPDPAAELFGALGIDRLDLRHRIVAIGPDK